MGKEQSTLNRKTVKNGIKMNQTINRLIKGVSLNGKSKDNNQNKVQLSYMNLQMRNENIIELSYNLMSNIAMTKVNTFNENIYYPITYFNPFEASSDTNNGDHYDKKGFLFHTEYSENVNKIFEIQSENNNDNNNANVPSAIDEDENEDIDNSQDEDKRKENDIKSKSRFASSSMKKVLNKKKTEKVGSEKVSIYSEVKSSSSSENQVLDSEKRNNTTAIKDNGNNLSTMKPGAYLVKSKTVASDSNSNKNCNNNILNTESKRSISLHYGTYTDEKMIEQPESMFDEHNKDDNDNFYAHYYWKNGKLMFRIEIKKLINQERFKKMYQQQMKVTKNSKNTTFIEQINKYMELDTSYNVKLNEIRSNKKLAVLKFKKDNQLVKVKKSKDKKYKQNTTTISNIIPYNDTISNRINSYNNRSSEYDDDYINSHIIETEKNYRIKYNNIIKSNNNSKQQQNYKMKRQEESNYISNDEDEFVSACSNSNISNANDNLNNTDRKKDSPQQTSNKSGFNEIKSINFNICE